jgi:hypothetical protein
MKVIKFRRELSKFILSGKKKATWRLFDDKNITSGDIVSFVVWESGEEFAKAKILNVVEKKFSELKQSDYNGHEPFSSEKEMYEQYAVYYNREIDENTVLKIIKFEIV